MRDNLYFICSFNAKKSRKMIDCSKYFLYLWHWIEKERELLTNDNVLSVYDNYDGDGNDDKHHIHHDDDPSGLG